MDTSIERGNWVNNIFHKCFTSFHFNKQKNKMTEILLTIFFISVLLFFLGSGPIRGFSITLGLGVVSTILCTMIISRLLINYFYILNPSREIEI